MTTPRGERRMQLIAPEKRRKIASLGGKAAHEKGTAHKFTSEEARIAGRKGGQISKRRPAKKVEENQ